MCHLLGISRESVVIPGTRHSSILSCSELRNKSPKGRPKKSCPSGCNWRKSRGGSENLFLFLFRDMPCIGFLFMSELHGVFIKLRSETYSFCLRSLSPSFKQIFIDVVECVNKQFETEHVESLPVYYCYQWLLLQDLITSCILVVFLIISFVISAVNAWLHSAIAAVCVSLFYYRLT